MNLFLDTVKFANDLTMESEYETHEARTSAPDGIPTTEADRASLALDTRLGRPPKPQSPQIECQCPEHHKSPHCQGIVRGTGYKFNDYTTSGQKAGVLVFCDRCGEDRQRRLARTEPIRTRGRNQ